MFQILTNNPMVREQLEGTCAVQYADISYKALLVQVRDMIHQGYRLLSHPLSGSVKPNETPYKSVMLSLTAAPAVDFNSEVLIENCLEACEKFPVRNRKWPEKVLADFQLIDYTLIDSAAASASVSS